MGFQMAVSPSLLPHSLFVSVAVKWLHRQMMLVATLNVCLCMRACVCVCVLHETDLCVSPCIRTTYRECLNLQGRRRGMCLSVLPISANDSCTHCCHKALLLACCAPTRGTPPLNICTYRCTYVCTVCMCKCTGTYVYKCTEMGLLQMWKLGPLTSFLCLTQAANLSSSFAWRVRLHC